jgi:hypothetical protein
MDVGLSVLSDVVTFNKYAKYLPQDKKREDYIQIVTRYLMMMIDKYPSLAGEIASKGLMIKKYFLQ